MFYSFRPLLPLFSHALISSFRLCIYFLTLFYSVTIVADEEEWLDFLELTLADWLEQVEGAAEKVIVQKNSIVLKIQCVCKRFLRNLFFLILIFSDFTYVYMCCAHRIIFCLNGLWVSHGRIED